MPEKDRLAQQSGLGLEWGDFDKLSVTLDKILEVKLSHIVSHNFQNWRMTFSVKNDFSWPKMTFWVKNEVFCSKGHFMVKMKFSFRNELMIKNDIDD